MPWSYQINGSFAFTGLAPTGTQLEFHSLAADLCTLQRAGQNFDATRAAAYGHILSLTDPAGVRRFYGRRTRSPGSATGQGEEHSMIFAGPWDWLERLTYHQTVYYKSATTGQLITAAQLVPRAILNVGPTNLALTIGAAITQVINYAILNGAPITVGVIDVDTVIRASEVVALSCADIIRNQLVYAPDVVCWFDYATTTPYPTFHCRRRAALAPVTLSLDQSKTMAAGYAIEGISSLVAHEDEVVPCVALYYEITDTLNGDPYVRLQYDIDPPTATGLAEDTFTDVIGLQGVQRTVISADLEIAALPVSAAQKKAFARQFFPFLANLDQCPDADFSITGITYDGSLSAAFDNYIVAGQPADWMDIEWQEQVIEVRVAYKWLGTDGSDIEVERDKPLNVRLRVTSEDTTDGETDGVRTYSAITAEADGDPIPTGLAASLRASLNTVEWSGGLLLTQTEATNLVALGQALNLTGTADPRHATMAALIKGITIDIDQGQTSITIGPDAILSLDRRIEMLKSNYLRRRWTSVTQQQTGEATGAGSLAQGLQGGGGNDTIHAPGARSYLAVRGAGASTGAAIVHDATGAKLSIVKNGTPSLSATIDLADPVLLAAPAANRALACRKVKVKGTDGTCNWAMIVIGSAIFPDTT